MAEAKSGIVLHPLGEVEPNMARQLGWVTNAVFEEGTVVGGAVHAVSYEPELVIEAIKLDHGGDLENTYFPAYYDDELKARQEEVRRELEAKIINHLAEYSGEEDIQLDGRRVDIIGPGLTPVNMLALSSLGNHLKTRVWYGSSTHDRRAHAWLQTDDGFYVPEHAALGSVGLRDPRHEYGRIFWGSIESRLVQPSTITLDAIVREQIETKLLSAKKTIVDTDGFKMTENFRDSHMVQTLDFGLPATEVIRAAMKKKIQEFKDIDRQANIDYAGNEDGYRDDGHWDLFGDYTPRPVSRDSLAEITVGIDPMDDPLYHERLN